MKLSIATNAKSASGFFCGKNMAVLYIRQRVRTVSLDSISEDQDHPLAEFSEAASDRGEQAEATTSILQSQNLRSLLTTRQLQVLALIEAGLTRREIAKSLKPPVCKQAVHQIVGRMRMRLHLYAGVPLHGWRRRNGTF